MEEHHAALLALACGLPMRTDPELALWPDLDRGRGLLLFRRLLKHWKSKPLSLVGVRSEIGEYGLD